MILKYVAGAIAGLALTLGAAAESNSSRGISVNVGDLIEVTEDSVAAETSGGPVLCDNPAGGPDCIYAKSNRMTFAMYARFKAMRAKADNPATTVTAASIIAFNKWGGYENTKLGMNKDGEPYQYKFAMPSL